MKTLILTEKPSVAKDFARALQVTPRGKGVYESDHYVITWAIGHLLSPYDPADYDSKWKRWSLNSLPIIPQSIAYKPIARTAPQLNIVVKAVQRTDVSDIVVATDAGREGELIARLILAYAKVRKNCWRFWTSQALNPSIIHKVLEDRVPLRDYDRLFHAGRSRQTADWLVGMNLSRLATLKFGDLFSIGRVQTAVLALLVKRRREIDDFKSDPYWSLKAKFSYENGEVTALWFNPDLKSESTRITDEKSADQLVKSLKGKEVVLHEIKEVNKKQNSPMLFSLTELQRVANRRFGFSAKKTLECAQNLYQNSKCLSYPRTDSQVVGSKSLSLIQGLFKKFESTHNNYFEKKDLTKLALSNRLVFNDAKLTDHHALLPLKPYSGSNPDEAKIFDLVLRRFVMAFSRDYEWKETLLFFNVDLEKTKENFKTSGKMVKEIGWKILEKEEKDILLPKLQKGEKGTVKSLKKEDKKTLPPPEYTEASLLKDMVNPARLVSEAKLKKVFKGQIGLGTQATRAQIIETLLNRKYIKRVKSNLIALEKGCFLIDNLHEMKTSRVLTSPEETALWEMKLEEISQGEGDVLSFVNSIKDFIVASTEEWRNCTSKVKSIPTRDVNKKQMTDAGGFGPCPLCKSEIIESPKAYGCSRWREGCKFTLWKKRSGKKISKVQAGKLFKKGSTDLIKGWKSKEGKVFNARLILELNGDINFQFGPKDNSVSKSIKTS